MNGTPAQFNPPNLQYDSCYLADSAWIADELARLELLVPEVARGSSRDPQAYALAFVESYQGDVLQTEYVWEFLYAAVTQAWQKEEYSVVIRLVTGLTYVVGRLRNLAQAERILHLGIAASRRVEDRQRLGYFLSCLGCLFFAQGKYRQGRRIWSTSMKSVGSPDAFPCLWEPLYSFAFITDMLGSYTAARQFVETLLKARTNDHDSLIVALFARGFHARIENDLERACEDLTDCLRLLSHRPNKTRSTAYLQLFTMAIQAELARAQGDYPRSQKYTETAISLAQVFSDHYTVAALLIDQGLYTYRQGQLADTQTTYLRLRDVTCQMAAPHTHECTHYLERHLAGIKVELYKPLSEREIEVLQLVAEGLPNREIATKLVISPGTVKKHLEHIYNRLDTHSRTSAVARARTLDLLS